MSIKRIKNQFNQIDSYLEKEIWIQRLIMNRTKEKISQEDLLKFSDFLAIQGHDDLQYTLLMNLNFHALPNKYQLKCIRIALELKKCGLAQQLFQQLGKQRSYEYYLLEALIENNKGNLETAVIQLEILHHHYPKKVEVLTYLGDLYMQIGQKIKALTCFLKAYPLLDPNSHSVEIIGNHIISLKLSLNIQNYEEYESYFLKFSRRKYIQTTLLYWDVQLFHNKMDAFKRSALCIHKLNPDTIIGTIAFIRYYHANNKIKSMTKAMDRAVATFSHLHPDFIEILNIAKKINYHCELLFLKATQHYEIIKDMESKRKILDYIIESAILLSKYKDALNFLNKIASEMFDASCLSPYYLKLYSYIGRIDQSLFWIEKYCSLEIPDQLKAKELFYIFEQEDIGYQLLSYLMVNPTCNDKHPLASQMITEWKNQSFSKGSNYL